MPNIDLNEAFASAEAKFKRYRDLLRGVAEGRVRHLFVEGTSGLGKSFEANRIFKTFESQRKLRLQHSAGRTTPLGLYNDLHKYRRRGDISVFDDCDSVLENKDALNILKAATDTVDRREIAWGGTSTRVDVPRFLFEGSVVVITNVNLARPKYANLMDRVLHLPLRLSPEEKIARIILILRADTKYQFCHDQVTQWLIRHHGDLADKLTVRTAIKCLELAAFNQDRWQELAEATILGGDQ